MHHTRPGSLNSASLHMRVQWQSHSRPQCLSEDSRRSRQDPMCVTWLECHTCFWLTSSVGCCAVIVAGGSSHRVRDAAPAAFLVGHSIPHWLLQASVLPVYLLQEGRLSVPPHQRVPQGSVSSWLHSSSSPALVSASA